MMTATKYTTVIPQTRTYVPPPSTTGCASIHPPLTATPLPIGSATSLYYPPTVYIYTATPTLAILHPPAYEDGTDREFQNVGQ
jgi:hypothetical protein